MKSSYGKFTAYLGTDARLGFSSHWATDWQDAERCAKGIGGHVVYLVCNKTGKMLGDEQTFDKYVQEGL